MEDRQALAMKYLELLQSGMPAAEAFKIVYPKGVPTQSQQAAKEAKAKQSSALAGTGGMIAGLMGIKYGSKYLDSLGGTSTAPAEAVTGAGSTAATASGTVAPVSAGAPVESATGAGLLSQAPGTTLLGSETAGAFLPAAGVAAGAYTGYQQGKGLLDAFKGNKLSKQQQIALALPTFGASLIYNKLPGVGHKSTRQTAKENTQNLLNASDNANYQNYINAMREQYNSAPIDKSKQFAGKYGSFDEYQKAGLDANDLTGVYGNLKLGQPYTDLTFDQKKAFTQSQIDKGNYQSKKGEVIFKDAQAAQADLNEYLKNFGTQKPKNISDKATNFNKIPTAFDKRTLAQNAAFGDKLINILQK